MKGQSSGFRQSGGLIEDDCNVTGGIVLWGPDEKKKLFRRKSQTKFLKKDFRQKRLLLVNFLKIIKLFFQEFCF